MAGNEVDCVRELCFFCNSSAVNKKVKCCNCQVVFHNSCAKKSRKKCCDKRSFIEDDADEAVSNKNINFVDKFQDTIDKLQEKKPGEENYELKEKVKNDHTIIIPEMTFKQISDTLKEQFRNEFSLLHDKINHLENIISKPNPSEKAQKVKKDNYPNKVFKEKIQTMSDKNINTEQLATGSHTGSSKPPMMEKEHGESSKGETCFNAADIVEKNNEEDDDNLEDLEHADEETVESEYIVKLRYLQVIRGISGDSSDGDVGDHDAETVRDADEQSEEIPTYQPLTSDCQSSKKRRKRK
ncbi:hypothetical protein JTB14_027880 [Gonioctena quinquepunctata]|nr:hypothetical protein JTB14_027880 [Gonioctena quinquepunctata]